MINRRLIVPLCAAVITFAAGQAVAQSPFPAPLPSQAPSASPFPPVNGAAPAASVGAPSPFPATGAAPIAGGGAGAFSPAPQAGGGGGGPQDNCMKDFMPLRQEAERRGKAIKTASDRKATPAEACKLIGNFSQAEVKMIKYVEVNSSKCGIPGEIAQQLKAGHKNTEQMQAKVCNVAQQAQVRAPAGPSLSDVVGSSAAMPEATPTKKGGSTFDTLSGNVLTR